MRLAGAGAGGKKKAPESGPEVSWKESSVDTGVAEPLVNCGAVGDSPTASSAWMTNAVESGSLVAGVAWVLGKSDQPASPTWPPIKKERALDFAAADSAPCATRPSRASDVALVSGPLNDSGVPPHSLRAPLSGVVHPPSGHCSATSQATAARVWTVDRTPADARARR